MKKVFFLWIADFILTKTRILKSLAIGKNTGTKILMEKSAFYNYSNFSHVNVTFYSIIVKFAKLQTLEKMILLKIQLKIALLLAMDLQ